MHEFFYGFISAFVAFVFKNIKTTYEEKFISYDAYCYTIFNKGTSKTGKYISAKSHAAKAFYG
jgi:hypothetical protein